MESHSSSGQRSRPALLSRSEPWLPFFLVEQVESLLPFSFAFAAGAMLALVMAELVPQAFTTGTTWPRAAIGTASGAAVMFALSAVLGV